ncbi:MAG: hypothetical protein WBE48_29545, partial [Xanthobacteraceae bacterium]
MLSFEIFLDQSLASRYREPMVDEQLVDRQSTADCSYFVFDAIGSQQIARRTMGSDNAERNGTAG